MCDARSSIDVCGVVMAVAVVFLFCLISRLGVEAEESLWVGWLIVKGWLVRRSIHAVTRLWLTRP